MFNQLREEINGTRSDFRQIANFLVAHLDGGGSSAPVPLDSTPTQPGDIPVNPKQEDYGHLKYWNRARWDSIRNGIRTEMITTPIISLFYEDWDGSLISDDICKQVRRDLAAYWIDVHIKYSEEVTSIENTGLTRQDHYIETMENRYPWLRLCEGHWKARQIWKNHFKADRVASMLAAASGKADIIELTDSECSKPVKRKIVGVSDSKDSRSTAPKTVVPVIEVSSDEEQSLSIPDSSSLTGSKRAHEGESDAGPVPSKKAKGKEKEVDTIPFHHTRPQPRKKPAKLAKVSEHSLLFKKYPLKTRRLIYCIYFIRSIHGMEF